jgi:small subunit ribosomal protein S16
MVRLRLARDGKKNRAFYHIVAAIRLSAPHSRLESVGYYNPFAAAHEKALWINAERYQYWHEKGAQTSKRVQQLFKQWKKLQTAISS